MDHTKQQILGIAMVAVKGGGRVQGPLHVLKRPKTILVSGVTGSEWVFRSPNCMAKFVDSLLCDDSPFANTLFVMVPPHTSYYFNGDALLDEIHRRGITPVHVYWSQYNLCYLKMPGKRHIVFHRRLDS